MAKDKKLWWVTLIKGMLFIWLGSMALLNPELTLLTLGLYIGWVAVITGTFYVFQALRFKSDKQWKFFIIEGLLDIFLGILMVVRPRIIIELFPFVVGIWLFFMGLTQITMGWVLKNAMAARTVWLIVLGILSVISSIVIIVHPVRSSLVLTVFIGAYFLFFGIIIVVSNFFKN